MNEATVCGVKLHYLPLAHMADRISDLASEKRPGYICIANTHQIVLANESASLRMAVEQATMNVPDSTVLLKAAGLRNRSLTGARPYRGYDMLCALLGHMQSKALPVGFYGGTPEVIRAIVDRCRRDYPSLRIAHNHSPPFRNQTPEEEREECRLIREAGVRLLFVGLGCPKQELWMSRNYESIGIPCVGIGAAFDFFAGAVKPSPPWVHPAGLEWLYRLCAEPRRLFGRYMVNNPKFLYLLARSWLTSSRDDT